MVRRLRSWWQKIKKHPVIAAIVILALIALAVFVFAVHTFGWDWTGFNGGYGQVTTHTPTKDTVIPSAKTLWDWLQLLIIPLALALVALVFNQTNTYTERQIAKQRYEQALLFRS